MKKIFANSAVRKSAALIRDALLGLTFPFSLSAISHMAPMWTSSRPIKHFSRPLVLGGGLSLAFNTALNNALPTAEDYLADLGVPEKIVRDLTGGVPTRINDGSTWIGRVYGQYNTFLSEHEWAINITKNLVFFPDRGSRLWENTGAGGSFVLPEMDEFSAREAARVAGLRWKIKKELGLKQQCNVGLSLGPESGLALRVSALYAQVPEEAIKKALPFSDREIRLAVIFHELAHCSSENQKMEWGPESETNADIKALKALKDLTGKDLRHALVLLRALNIPQFDPEHAITMSLQTWAETGTVMPPSEQKREKEEYRDLLEERLSNINSGYIGRFDKNGIAIIFHDLIYLQICAFMKEGPPPYSTTKRAQLYLEAVETYLLPDGKTAPCDLPAPPERKLNS